LSGEFFMRLRYRHRHQFGGALIEYALLVALIALATINAVRSYGKTVDCRYRALARTLREPGFDPSTFGGLQYFCDNPSAEP
jgi:Flp pilus assembly pilin Flp